MAPSPRSTGTSSPNTIVLLAFIVGFVVSCGVLLAITDGPFRVGELSGLGGLIFGSLFAVISIVAGGCVSIVVALVLRWRGKPRSRLVEPVTTKEPPYRDGVEALLRSFEVDRDRARQLAASLEGSASTRVPVRLRRELTALEDALDTTPGTVVEIGEAEALLEKYVRTVEAALVIAEGDPTALRRMARHRRLLWGALAALLVALAFWGYVLGQRYRRYTALCERGCDVDGRCHPRWIDVLYDRNDVPSHDHNRCVALEPRDCEEPCRVWGRCHLAPDVCEAGGDEDCQKSERCRIEGECHALRSGNYTWGGTAGVCVIRTQQDCLQSLACAQEGRCRVGDSACAE